MLDPDMFDVTVEAGKAIVQAMVHDAWATFRPRITRLLHRGEAGQLVDSLESDRQALRSGRLAGDLATGRWQARMEAVLQRHPELAPDLVALVAEIRAESTVAPAVQRQSVTMTRGSAFQAAGDIVGSGNRTTTKKSYGGIAAIVAVAVVLLIVGAGVVNTVILPALESAATPSITAETPCGEYLRASYAEREQAVQRIAVELKVSGAGHPFLILNVDDQCGNQLDTPVGTVIGRQQY